MNDKMIEVGSYQSFHYKSPHVPTCPTCNCDDWYSKYETLPQHGGNFKSMVKDDELDVEHSDLPTLEVVLVRERCVTCGYEYLHCLLYDHTYINRHSSDSN